MERRKAVTFEQLILLIDFVQVNPDIAKMKNRLRRRECRGVYNQLWEDCAKVINSVGDSATKTGIEWRRYFTDFKYKMKNKLRTMKYELETKGSTNIELSSLEIRLKTILESEEPNNISNEEIRPSDNSITSGVIAVSIKQEEISRSPIPILEDLIIADSEELSSITLTEDITESNPQPQQNSAPKTTTIPQPRLRRKRKLKKIPDNIDVTKDRLARIEEERIKVEKYKAELDCKSRLEIADSIRCLGNSINNMFEYLKERDNKKRKRKRSAGYSDSD